MKPVAQLAPQQFWFFLPLCCPFVTVFIVVCLIVKVQELLNPKAAFLALNWPEISGNQAKKQLKNLI
ncbi:MAG: hypothetical protein PHZ04_03225 [Patescibacteria group bacterium]|nr:hypothetical protein [Patescibacteria group bacterium]